MQNKYIKRAHIDEKKFREILKFFAEDLTTTQIAKFTAITRTNISNILQKIHYRIYDLSLKENLLLSADIECDESYFGGKRVRSLRGRAASGKIKVFGLLKRGENIFTEVVDDV